MLMLLFYIGENLHAIDAERVVEVIPRVHYRSVHHLPDYVAGLFNYRGKIVPAIDLCHFIRGKPSQNNLSTRVMMVSYLDQEVGELKYIALIAERVNKTLNKSKDELVDSGINNDDFAFLNKTIFHENAIVNYIDTNKLFAKLEEHKLVKLGYNIDVNDNN